MAINTIRLNSVEQKSTLNTPTSAPQGTYHLADNPNLYEIQRGNNFELVVTGLDNILRAGATGTESNATFANAQEVIRISVSQAFVPHFTQDAIEVKRGNNSIKFAGVPKFESGTIVVNDYIGADTKAAIMAWQNLSYNVITEKVGLASDYKKEAYLIEHTPDFQKVRQWKLHGCWVSGISEDAFDSDSNDKHKITVTIQYDRAEIDMSENA